MIIHFTTVHPRDDSRIRSKEVDSLARAFGEIALYVQDGLGNAVDGKYGYPIIDTGPRLSRMRRMTLGGWRMFNAVRIARPAVAHFHDPELLPWAIMLKFFGIKIVYDVHEDVPRQVRHNTSIPKFIRYLVSPCVSLTEWVAAKFLNGIVVATGTIQDRFPAKKTTIVHNFPILDELVVPNSMPMRERPNEICYVGAISDNRNILGMISATDKVSGHPICLRLAGYFAPIELETAARNLKAWKAVKFDGFATRQGVAEIMSHSRAGLVLLKPIKHEMVALPIKLFEYMAAGLPVISSDFPVWRNIVAGAECGLLVDPLDVDAIGGAMQWVLDNPDEAQEMGARGRKAILTQYNWEKESSYLVNFYNEVLGLSKTAV